MSNAIKIRSTESCAVIVPDFEKERKGDAPTIADEPRRLKISVSTKKKSDGSGTFKAVKGYVKIEVINDEGASEGVKVKRLDVHFRKDAFKGAMNVHTPEDLKSGYLYVRAKGLQIPPFYKIEEKKDDNGNVIYDENGEAMLKYPSIWIQSDIIGLEEFVTSQHALDVDEDENIVPTSYNEETGEVEDYTQYDEEVELPSKE